MVERFRDKTWVQATIMWYAVLAWIGVGIMFGLIGWYVMFGIWIGGSILIGMPYIFYKTYHN